MLVLLTLIGLAVGFWTGRNAPSIVSRRRAGALLLSLLGVVVLAFAGALAASHRGFTGSDLAHAALAHRPTRAGPVQHARAA